MVIVDHYIVCQKGTYGLRMGTSGIYNDIVSRFGDKVEMMPEDTDWKNLSMTDPKDKKPELDWTDDEFYVGCLELGRRARAEI